MQKVQQTSIKNKLSVNQINSISLMRVLSVWRVNKIIQDYLIGIFIAKDTESTALSLMRLSF